MGTLFRNGRVEFIENSFLGLHNYILDGEKSLIGVTTLIKKHKLAEGYDGIHPVTLRVAAEIGTAAHRYIESYCNGEAVLDTPLLKTFQAQNIRVVETEYLMSDNETVASSMDLLAEVDGEPDTYDIIDIKRTEKVHTDSLQWQLGFYRWLFLMANPWAKVRGCYCLHIKKGMKAPLPTDAEKDDICRKKGYTDASSITYDDFLEFHEEKFGRPFNANEYILKDKCEPLIPVKPMDERQILGVMECERKGWIFKEVPPMDALPITEQERVALPAVLKKVADLEAELEATQKVIADAKSRLYDWMVANGRDRVILDNIILSVRKGSIRTTIDAERLREDYADIAEKYSKTTVCKGSLQIKVKDDKG